MKLPEFILLVKSEQYIPGLSPDLTSALLRADYRIMIADTCEIESIASLYCPVLAIAKLSGRPEADLILCHLLLQLIHAPVIAISPLDDVDNRITMLDAGITDYLISPVNPLEFVIRVRNILNRRSQHSTLHENLDLLWK
jgi:DNA-binding response OmpR family regulator